MQVLNLNGNHWIVLSTIGCPPAAVNVYDSLHGTLSAVTKHLFADMLRTKFSELTLQHVALQWQSNAVIVVCLL